MVDFLGFHVNAEMAFVSAGDHDLLLPTRQRVREEEFFCERDHIVDVQPYGLTP